ncbi:MAG: hypothetical protein L0Y72_04495 [Gemmataceae bacterium]|nr:hypothetical protein [Gemmataceae bacterium]MCI0738280.1 hypothetical protein [Gemmataceae bacterium]
MSLQTPDWLARRGGTAKLGSDGQTWFVILDSKPNYALTPVPVGGNFSCYLRQTINGRRLNCPGSWTSAEDAIRGGLEVLRKLLGWE